MSGAKSFVTMKIVALFLATLEQAVETFGIVLHGYCLMPNHYHILIETRRANLSRAVGWLQTNYTIRLNRRHRRSGHLFQGRFKAHLVEADVYAMGLLRYLHLNPVRPRDKTALVPRERLCEFENYEWSSHQSYLGIKAAPPWLAISWLRFFCRSKVKAQRDYRAFVEAAFRKALESPWENLHGGLVLGGQELKDKVHRILKESSNGEEVAWVRRTEGEDRRKSAAIMLAETEKERCWKAWLRVRLGGERRIDVAHALGYSDGSAITHTIKRLESRVEEIPSFVAYATALERKFERTLATLDA